MAVQSASVQRNAARMPLSAIRSGRPSAIAGALLAALSCLLPLHASIFNVRAFGATANGRTNDAPAIQAAEMAAERAGGGQVYLPAGSYWVDDTIVIGSNIDFYGDGDRTVLIRSNHGTTVRLYGSDCAAAHPPTSLMRMLLVNRRYNCVDQNIHLHDFKADGSQMTIVPSGPMIAFSGLVNSVVEHVTVMNAPQDAMFFRNGGVNLLVQDNTILIHDRLWGNGHGVNIEMHKEGHSWGGATIRGNTIVTAGDTFCTASLSRACSTDGDCANLRPPTCGHGAANSASIGVFWVDGPHPPQVEISGNHIWVGNRHFGIICNGCINSTIRDNVILPATQRGIAVSGAFIGISYYSTPAGPPHGVTIEGNTIEGDGQPRDGAAIQVTGATTRGDGLVIRNNLIRNKSSQGPALLVRGWDHVDVSDNVLCGMPDGAVRLGEPNLPVRQLHSTGNVTSPPGHKQPPACSAPPQTPSTDRRDPE